MLKYWDFLLVASVPEFYIYVLVALVAHNRLKLFQATVPVLPQVITSIRIESLNELQDILRRYAAKFYEAQCIQHHARHSSLLQSRTANLLHVQ